MRAHGPARTFAAGLVCALLATALAALPAPAAEPSASRPSTSRPAAAKPAAARPLAAESLAAVVRASEIAFARSLADRDLTAFGRFVSRDAVFVNGSTTLRGRDAVVAGWKPYFDGPDAPFSWSPEQVEVLADGTLAFSTGPVLNPNGERIGTYKSTWRRERDGQWRVVIDSGCTCRPAGSPSAGN